MDDLAAAAGAATLTLSDLRNAMIELGLMEGYWEYEVL